MCLRDVFHMTLNRYAKKRDANEKEIVDALESIGCTVCRLDRPCDLIVGYRARNYLIEIKTPNGRLTKAQQDFIPAWKGQVRVLETVDEALELVTQAYGRED